MQISSHTTRLALAAAVALTIGLTLTHGAGLRQAMFPGSDAADAQLPQTPSDAAQQAAATPGAGAAGAELSPRSVLADAGAAVSVTAPAADTQHPAANMHDETDDDASATDARTDPEEALEDDTVLAHDETPGEAEPLYPDTPVGRLLSRHSSLVEGIGPDASANYEASMEALRKRGRESVELLANAYDRIDSEQYLERWKVVDTLSTLRSAHSLESLATIAAEPIAASTAESMEDSEAVSEHAVRPQTEEALIRIAALEGIEALAVKGVAGAETQLQAMLSADNGLVRENAVRAYLRVGTNEQQRRAELRAALPESDHWMLRLRDRSDPTRMAQPSPSNEVDAHIETETDESLHEQRGDAPADGAATRTTRH